MQWQREQVLALAPDQASIKAAQSLMTISKWPSRGRTTDALWGECQGSGKTPYRTAIDLREPAFKCSCPSRKFPCKHALALFLLAIQSDGKPTNATLIEAQTIPEWVQSWLDGRTHREAARVAKAAEVSSPVEDTATGREQTATEEAGPQPIEGPAATGADRKAAERRATARAAKVAAGLDELTIWLKDLIRGGYVDAQTRPHSHWQQMAARLIDAQAPGLATQVQELASILLSGGDWASRFTAAIGRLYLLIEAYQRIEQLPAPLQQEIRSQIGWYQSKEEVLAQPGVHGRWQVLSQTVEQEENLLSQRIWLRAVATGAYALILNFAHPSNRQTLDLHWRSGTVVDATLHFYASALPLRALAANSALSSPPRSASPMPATTQGCAIADALHLYQQALAHNPWVTRYPLTLADVIVGIPQQPGQRNHGGNHAYLYDEECHTLPLSRSVKNHWKALSITGGKPATIFGEWASDGFAPLGLWHKGNYWAL